MAYEGALMTDEHSSWEPGIFGWQGTDGLPIPAR